MDDPVIEPDPLPEEIDPKIVAVYRKNLTLQQYMALYLSKQITWRECLEHSLLHLDQQHEGAILMAEQNARQQLDLKVEPPEKKKVLLKDKIKVCPVCSFSAWLTEDGAQGTGQVCAVCDAKRGSSQARHLVDQIKLCILELERFYQAHGDELPQRLSKLLNESDRNKTTKRLQATRSE